MLVLGLPPELGVRRKLLSRFPHAIVFVEGATFVRVISVMRSTTTSTNVIGADSTAAPRIHQYAVDAGTPSLAATVALLNRSNQLASLGSLSHRHSLGVTVQGCRC